MNIQDLEENNENQPLILQGDDQLLLERARDQFNTYATHKSVSQNLLNTAIITQYIGIIINLFSLYDPKFGFSGFEITLIILLALSLVLQIIIFTLLVLLAKTTRQTSGKCCNTSSINTLVTTLSGISVIVNIAITAIWIQVQSNYGTRKI